MSNTLYAITRGSKFAGVGSWSEIVYASRDQAARDAMEPEQAWDGVAMSSQWETRHIDLEPSKRILTLLARGCKPGLYEDGVWIHDPKGRVIRSTRIEHAFGYQSTLTEEEQDYCRAWLYAEGVRLDDLLPEYKPTGRHDDDM